MNRRFITLPLVPSELPAATEAHVAIPHIVAIIPARYVTSEDVRAGRCGKYTPCTNVLTITGVVYMTTTLADELLRTVAAREPLND